jgi:DNA primase
MANLLSSSFIKQVKEAANIVRVIEKKVALKRSGKDWVGLCPFHLDKSPSMSISEELGLYKCFSCGASGDVFQFLSDFNKYSFREAVLELSKELNIFNEGEDPVEREKAQKEYDYKQKCLSLASKATEYFHSILISPEGKAGADYLEERGITKTSISNFKIGFALDSWVGILDWLNKEGLSLEIATEIGLLRHKDGRHYDYFRSRVIIPICNEKGQVVGFTGRSVASETIPKYLNSPESCIFSKAKTLFGIDKAKDSIREREQIILVEGHLDAVSLHQRGITNSVAIQGTALSKSQIRLAARYTESNNIVLGLDSDDAGIAATEKILEQIDKAKGELGISSSEIRILVLPYDVKDPDSYLQLHSPSDFAAMANRAQPSLEWRIALITKAHLLSDPIQFKKAYSAILEAIGLVESKLDRLLLTHKASFLLCPGNPRLAEETEAQLNRSMRFGNSSKDIASDIDITQGQISLFERLEFQLIQLYLWSKESRDMIREAYWSKDMLFFSSPGNGIIWDLILSFDEGKDAEEIIEELLALDMEFLDRQKISNLMYLSNTIKANTLIDSLARQAVNSMILASREASYSSWIDCWEKSEYEQDASLCQEEMLLELEEIKTLKASSGSVFSLLGSKSLSNT